MCKWLYGYIVIWLIFLVLPRNIYAAITINEIYPAPTTGDYEWVELYNDESYVIDLSTYSLYDLAGNSIKIILTTLPAYEFVIASSSSVLNNSGDTVYLKNNLNEVIETVSYPAGITAEKSYAKCPDGNGQWFSLNWITKNISNAPACLTLTPTDSPTPIPTPTTELTLIPTYEPSITSYNNIYLSEVMVNPPTGENEWVEIYNQNNFAVNLDNWYIDDLESSGSSPKIFSMVIDARSFQVFELTSSMFNNDGDSVRLLDFNKNLKDSFEYSKSEKGKSWGRVNFASDQFCLQNPSKNQPNYGCLNQTTTVASTIKLTPSPTLFINKINLPTSRLAGNSTITRSDFLIPSPGPKQNNQFGSILGANRAKTINNSQLTINVLSLVSLTHSILTILFLFLKIKIHEGI